MSSLLQQLTRRKKVEFGDTALPRILNLFDLTALGVGSTIGVGFYVLAGSVAHEKAGPGVVVSFVIAAIASVLSGICYAEFGGRVPKAGSAYIYAYVCIGEFVAFVIGWNLILEYLIGTASVAVGFGGYIDRFTGSAMSAYLTSHVPIGVDMFAVYPHFLAAGLCLVLTAMLAYGVRESALFNNIMSGVNMFIVVYVIISVATKANPSNWFISKANLSSVCTDKTKDFGEGGFAPYGIQGIISGASSCFYGFVGYDIICSTGEEAKRPERNLPLSIIISLGIIFLCYLSMSIVVTMAIPYCNLDVNASIITLYSDLDMTVSYWIVSIGAICGFSACLLGALMPMPRIIYAMATDGVVFRYFAKIDPRTKSPVRATVLSGVFAALMSVLFDITVLVDMMSIGTLQAYSIVALCVMMLRYSNDPCEIEKLTQEEEESRPSSPLPVTSQQLLRQIFNRNGYKAANNISTKYAGLATLAYALLALLLAIMVTVAVTVSSHIAVLCFIGVLVVLCLTVLASLACQPLSTQEVLFKVPGVPWLPGASVLINLYLMCNMGIQTWYKFGVWLLIGTSVYFVYAIWYGSVDAAIANQDKEEEGAETYDHEVMEVFSHPSSRRNTRQSSVFSRASSAKSNAVSEKLEQINAGFDHSIVKNEEVNGGKNEEVNGGEKEEVNSGNNEPVPQNRFIVKTEVEVSNSLEKY